MSESKLSQKDVEEILRMVQSADHVVDFRFKYGDLEINLSRSGGPSPAGAHPSTHTTPDSGSTASSSAVDGLSTDAIPKDAVSSASVSAPKKKLNSVPEGFTAVKAPMVGTFYRAPSPGATPFVSVGAKVDPDTVVGIIEVMKLMNSLSAGVSGTVREVRVGDSQPVGFGDVLIVIEPDE